MLTDVIDQEKHEAKGMTKTLKREMESLSSADEVVLSVSPLDIWSKLSSSRDGP